MRLQHESTTGDLFLTDELIVFGQVNGNIYIQSGGNLVLDGECTGIVVVQEGGKARIAGIVGGYVFNMGGELLVDEIATIRFGGFHIFGMTFGEVGYISDFGESDIPGDLP